MNELKPVEIPQDKIEPFLEGYLNHGFDRIDKEARSIKNHYVPLEAGLSRINGLVAKMRNVLKETKNILQRG